MPAARAKPAFKAPPALARLAKSIQAAEDALAQLGKTGSVAGSRTSRDLQREVRKFLVSARRDTKKLGGAMKRDFDSAQRKAPPSRGAPKRRPAASKSARAATRPPAKRAAAKRATAKRTTAKKG